MLPRCLSAANCLVIVIGLVVTHGVCNEENTSRRVGRLSWNDLRDFDSPKDQLVWDTILSNERKHTKKVEPFGMSQSNAPIDTSVSRFDDYSRSSGAKTDFTPRKSNKRRKSDYRSHKKKWKHLRNTNYLTKLTKTHKKLKNHLEKDESLIVPQQLPNNSYYNRTRWNFLPMNSRKAELLELTRNLEYEIMKMREEHKNDTSEVQLDDIKDLSIKSDNKEIVNSNREINFFNKTFDYSKGLHNEDNDGTRSDYLMSYSRSSENSLDHRFYNSEVLGDLSCMNGTFVPAPHVTNGVIKYVKSSKPDQEYLEADYECIQGYIMSSTINNTRLLCKNRQWIGDLPICIKKPDELCLQSDCEQICNVDNGLAKCSCQSGYQVRGSKCIDVNECEKANGNCQYTCVNFPGGYRCECPRGMIYGENKFTCVDVNECELNNGRGPCQDRCSNTIGGYICSCEGLPSTILSSDNHTCQPAIGHCQDNNNAGCSHTCLSTGGRIFCLCPDGFVLKDDWKTCQDVDECAVPELQTELCQHGCINTPGSYRCIEPLEVKDDPDAEERGSECPSGYRTTLNFNCIDINECEENNGGCSEVCENTDGSYFCACDGDEKILSSDGKTCLEINAISCPPVSPVKRGTLICSRQASKDNNTWQPYRGVNRPGTKCYLKCPRNYQLLGEYQITCRPSGKWEGQQSGECLKSLRPRLECPQDITAETPPGESEAFVKFNQPASDVDWFRYIKSKPPWGTRLEANLPIGVHPVTFIAHHPITKKQADCTFRIVIKEGEPPRAEYCPEDIVGRNGSIPLWDSPVFTDNVKVTKVTTSQSPSRPFDIGQWRITYNATDDAGWSAVCSFNLSIRQD